MRNTFQVLFGAHGKLPITTDLTQPLLPRDQPAAGNTATNLGQVGLPFCEAPIVHPDVLKRIDELLRRYRVDGSPFEIQSFLKNTVLTLPLAALGVRLIRTAAAIPFPNKYTTIGDFRSMTSLLWLKAPITREALSNALAASATTPLGSTDDQAAAQRDLLDALVPYQNELDPTVAPGWLAVAAWFENPAWLRTLLCNGIFSSPTVAFMAVKLYLDWHNDDTAQLSLEATKRLAIAVEEGRVIDAHQRDVLTGPKLE